MILIWEATSKNHNRCKEDNRRQIFKKYPAYSLETKIMVERLIEFTLYIIKVRMLQKVCNTNVNNFQVWWRDLE